MTISENGKYSFPFHVAKLKRLKLYCLTGLKKINLTDLTITEKNQMVFSPQYLQFI